jgi:hypothetical protein
MRLSKRFQPILFFMPLLGLPLHASPPSLGGNVQGITVNLPDPKLPGKLLCEIHADSASGQSAENGFLGQMRSVHARLYQSGRPSATLDAPQATGRSVGKSVVVTGTGRVTVISLSQPGTKLLADTVVWYASINKLQATGHVFYRDGKSGATMTGPRLIADTKLKSVQIFSGHATAHL